jgi:hypothetical protein
MDESQICSKMVKGTVIIQIECGHCHSLNFVVDNFSPTEDSSKMDIEAVTCWDCQKDSLIDPELLNIYPNGTEEAVNIVEGNHSENIEIFP